MKGFTLVELSIVIIIIGLIVAGVSAGVSLAKNSTIRSTITNINKYKLAMTTFKIQYGYLPGDIPTAFSYWGTDCAATVVLCNGNGDRTVVWLSTEQFRVWQHLALSGLIEGQYSGVVGTPFHSTPGVNSPALSIKNSVINLIDAYTFTNRGLYLYFARSGPINSYANGGLLSPLDAYNIDIKTDDGGPGAGKVQSVNGWTPTVLTGSPRLTGCTSVDGINIPSTSTYVIQNSATNCIMAFFLDVK